MILLSGIEANNISRIEQEFIQEQKMEVIQELVDLEREQDKEVNKLRWKNHETNKQFIY